LKNLVVLFGSTATLPVMSGLEVGGIVLAAFPIALIAMEKYQTMLDQVNLWKTENQRLALETLTFEIRVQETLFRNSYQTLLLSFMDRATVIVLLSDPYEPDPQQQSLITDRLKRQLGEQWSLYDAVMRKLQKALDRLSEEVKKVKPNHFPGFICHPTILLLD
jgi:hypothetical protein